MATTVLDRTRKFARLIEQNARQARGYLFFRKSIRLRREWLDGSKAVGLERPIVLLDMRQILLDGEQGRRFYALVHLLKEGGYDVCLVPRLGFFQTSRKLYKQWALEAVIPWRTKKSGAGSVEFLITDNRSVARSNTCGAKRVLLLDSSEHRPLASDELPLPYTVHPGILQRLEASELERLRCRTRSWLVFFGGARDKSSYRDSARYTHAETINRYRLIQQAELHFAERCCLLASDDILRQTLAQTLDGLVLLDTAIHGVAADRWLDTLSRANFFIAAPGMTYPVSHNCVEALATGTIPILEYPELFQPHLEHGVNCLAFRGAAEFEARLNEIASMPADRIQSLRRGAIQYFEEHLSPRAFCEKLRHGTHQRIHMFPYLARSG